MKPNEHFDLTGLSHSPKRHERHWAGFSVEHVRPEQGASFGYDWTSDLHFCAYHDIVLRDGGIRAGDGAEDNRLDLRDTLTYVPTGARVSGWSALAKRQNAFTAIYFDPSVLDNELESRFSQSTGERVYFRDQDLASYLRQWARILNQGQNDALYEEALGLVTILAIHRASSALFARDAHPLGKTTLALIGDFIEQNLHSTITLSELASLAGQSRFHFSRAFKAVTGETPYQYVLGRRVDRAKLLLVDTKMTMDEVAKTTGFRDAAHFQRTFKLRLGISPHRFRSGR